MARFKRRIDTVDAVQYTGVNLAELIAFCGPEVIGYSDGDGDTFLQTPSGAVRLEIRDWVARNPTDPTDFYPIKADKFEDLYDPSPLPEPVTAG